MAMCQDSPAEICSSAKDDDSLHVATSHIYAPLVPKVLEDAGCLAETVRIVSSKLNSVADLFCLTSESLTQMGVCDEDAKKISTLWTADFKETEDLPDFKYNPKVLSSMREQNLPIGKRNLSNNAEYRDSVNVRENRSISSDQQNQNSVNTEEGYSVLNDKKIPIGTKESAKDSDNKNRSYRNVNWNRWRCKKNRSPSNPLFSKNCSSTRILQVSSTYNSIQDSTLHLKRIRMTLLHLAEKVHTIVAVDKDTSGGIKRGNVPGHLIRAVDNFEDELIKLIAAVGKLKEACGWRSRRNMLPWVIALSTSLSTALLSAFLLKKLFA